MSPILYLRFDEEIFARFQFSLQAIVVQISEQKFSINVFRFWSTVWSMQLLFLYSQRINTGKLLTAWVTLVDILWLSCALLLGIMKKQINLGNCWKTWTFTVVQCSSWASPLLPYNFLLWSLCSLFAAVEAIHFSINFWRD